MATSYQSNKSANLLSPSRIAFLLQIIVVTELLMVQLSLHAGWRHGQQGVLCLDPHDSLGSGASAPNGAREISGTIFELCMMVMSVHCNLANPSRQSYV